MAEIIIIIIITIITIIVITVKMEEDGKVKERKTSRV